MNADAPRDRRELTSGRRLGLMLGRHAGPISAGVALTLAVLALALAPRLGCAPEDVRRATELTAPVLEGLRDAALEGDVAPVTSP